jgi:hypothetical protein
VAGKEHKMGYASFASNLDIENMTVKKDKERA